MSDIVFDEINLKVDVDDTAGEFIKAVLKYAIPQALGDIGTYWHGDKAKDIINDSTFGYLWNEFPSERAGLIQLAESCSGQRDNHSKPPALSQQFAKDFVRTLFDSLEANDDLDDNRNRARFVRILDPSFDYLEEIYKYSLDESKGDLYTLWQRAGSNSSSDPAFFDYLWARVKHERGAVDIKESIVECAFENNALSDKLIGKIAKSSPKRIKRKVVGMLSQKISDKKYRIARWEKNPSAHSEIILSAKKEVAKYEAAAMLFVACDDREVVSNLLDCLSRDNLPWLMPSASKHPYLASRLDRLTNEDN
jgi:hypothetical protein